MFFRALLWGMVGVLLTGVSAEDKEVVGVLGESATFPLQSARPFDVALWNRNEMQVATLTWGTPCNITLFSTYVGRIVTTSDDCSSLTLRDVREEDSAEYEAQFLSLNPVKTVGTQTFTLRVSKRLSEADLEIHCEEEIRKDGNKTLHINCSAGKWGDVVGLSWTPYGQEDKTSSSEMSLVLLPNTEDDDQNVTCMAKNSISNISRTVSLKACAAGGQPTTRPSTVADTETGSPSSPPQTMLIGIVVGSMMFLAMFAVAAGVWRRRRNKAADRELITPSSNSGPKDCKTVYAEICNPEISDVEMGSPQQGKDSGSHKGMPITIYADVQHPEKTPLQTDDEKLRREKRRAAEKSEKTIYSEISDTKEANQGNLKTIYDTVNFPKPTEASEYNKIL